MTQEEKQLVFKDLCSRLPYGVIVYSSGIPHEQKLIGYIPDIEKYSIKPYLRPMSSMTKEEKKELFQLMGNGTDVQRIDFYLSHYLDYRGLIPMGLALPAHEGMYN